MARKRKTNKETKTNNATLPAMRPDAAGVDIGATEIFVAVPADRAAENVRGFATFTQDLYGLADWLEQCAIKTVAMESTGVYWIPLFQILEDRGLGGMPGQRTPRKERARAPHGRARLSVVAVLATAPRDRRHHRTDGTGYRRCRILTGERNPFVLAKLRDERIKASERSSPNR